MNFSKNRREIDFPLRKKSIVPLRLIKSIIEFSQKLQKLIFTSLEDRFSLRLIESIIQLEVIIKFLQKPQKIYFLLF